MEPVEIRSMTTADLGAADSILISSYGPVVPGQVHQTPAWLKRWRARGAHLLATDPEGCWAATLDGEMVGFALSFRREDTWFLSSYAVRQDLQGQGIGRLLLEAAEKYGADCPRAMLSASTDPKAEARYRAAGFALVPQWRYTGTATVEPEPLPPGDLDLDELDREVRGSGHGPDHAILREQFRLVTTAGGYAYLDGSGTPALLCARDTATASLLLRHALGTWSGEAAVAHVTEANPWARAVAEEAGLVAVRSGYLAVRGMEPPSPYLHHGALL